MSTFSTEHQRTHRGGLRASGEAKAVVLLGWADTRRDHGGCVFIDLRYREGITQVVFEPELDAAAHQAAGDLRTEYFTGASSLRDVIAFPKTQKGTDLLNEAPSPVSPKQLKDLFIQLAPGVEPVPPGGS